MSHPMRSIALIAFLVKVVAVFAFSKPAEVAPVSVHSRPVLHSPLHRMPTQMPKLTRPVAAPLGRDNTEYRRDDGQWRITVDGVERPYV